MSHIITNITIGNWYLVRGKAVKISSSNVVWAFRDGCFPVLLTTEVLEVNGFKREGGAAYWHGEEYSMVVLFWNEGRKELIVSKTGDNQPYVMKMDVQYVHQLQDILRLCNINITIEL